MIIFNMSLLQLYWHWFHRHHQNIFIINKNTYIVHKNTYKAKVGITLTLFGPRSDFLVK